MFQAAQPASLRVLAGGFCNMASRYLLLEKLLASTYSSSAGGTAADTDGHPSGQQQQ